MYTYISKPHAFSTPTDRDAADIGLRQQHRCATTVAKCRDASIGASSGYAALNVSAGSVPGSVGKTQIVGAGAFCTLRSEANQPLHD